MFRPDPRFFRAEMSAAIYNEGLGALTAGGRKGLCGSGSPVQNQAGIELNPRREKFTFECAPWTLLQSSRLPRKALQQSPFHSFGCAPHGNSTETPRQPTMTNFIVIIAYLGIGAGLRRLPRFPAETGTALNLYVIHVALPALVLLKVPELDFAPDLFVPAIMPWAMLALSAAVVLAVSRAAGWSREVTGSLLLLVPLGNTSFLGIPMVRAFFGEEAIPFAVLYDQFGTFLGLSTYGSVVLALYGPGSSRPTLAAVTVKIATFPPFLALALAILLRGFQLPEAVRVLLQSLAATLVPMVMIAVGFQLTLRLPRDTFAPLSAGLFLKLVAAPLAALAACRGLGLAGPAVDVSILEAGMPPMISAGALALLANLAPALTAALVGLGIILSFVSLPLLHQALSLF